MMLSPSFMALMTGPYRLLPPADGAGAAGGAIGLFSSGGTTTTTALSLDSNTFMNNSVRLRDNDSCKLGLWHGC